MSTIDNSEKCENGSKLRERRPLEFGDTEMFGLGRDVYRVNFLPLKTDNIIVLCTSSTSPFSYSIHREDDRLVVPIKVS